MGIKGLLRLVIPGYVEMYDALEDEPANPRSQREEAIRKHYTYDEHCNWPPTWCDRCKEYH